ncbi:hypothetical protein EV361DRAFT_813509, partial [Lentinula raphanica]
MLILLAALAGGVLNHEVKKRSSRNPSRLYLTRPQLMPQPRLDSPWIRLWEGQNNRAFITTMGLDVATFRLILEGPDRFAARWESTPIPRPDVSSTGETRSERRSLDAAGALGLTLH